MLIMTLIGGLGLFLYGMRLMSDGIQKTAGAKLRDILEKLTKTRFLGLAVGLFFTAVIQSSSTATVMVVSFVNAGLMNLVQASGIILGANIGTTITALLVALKLSAIAPLFIFIGAFMIVFIKKAPLYNKIGEIILGFGILFLGITNMSSSMDSLKTNEAVVSFLDGLTNPFIALMIGLLITAIVQSSSVTVSILVVMAAQGLMAPQFSLYFVLGTSIGACVSAVLAGMAGNKDAKRAALIHLLFNVIGTTIFFILMLFLSEQIADIMMTITRLLTGSEDYGKFVAISQLVFKCVQVLMLYPFMDQIIKLTHILVPGTDATEETEFTSTGSMRLAYIGDHTVYSATTAVFSAVMELRRMAEMAIKNLNAAMEAVFTTGDNKEALKEIHQTEAYIDYLNQEITRYLVAVNKKGLLLADASHISVYFHVVNDIERIGDHAINIADRAKEVSENGVVLSKKGQEELRGMMVDVNQILNYSVEMFSTNQLDHLKEIQELEDKIDEMERELQKAHIRRLNKGKCSPEAGLIFNEILSNLERVADHATNIGFALTENDGLQITT